MFLKGKNLDFLVNNQILLGKRVKRRVSPKSTDGKDGRMNSEGFFFAGSVYASCVEYVPLSQIHFTFLVCLIFVYLSLIPVNITAHCSVLLCGL